MSVFYFPRLGRYKKYPRDADGYNAGDRSESIAELFEQMLQRTRAQLLDGAAIAECALNSNCYRTPIGEKTELRPVDVLIDRRLLNSYSPTDAVAALKVRNAKLRVGQLWIGGFIVGRAGKDLHKLSQAEALGRLYAFGFEVVELITESNGGVFLARKTGAPVMKRIPSRGLFIRLERIGWQGRPLRVYKVRTMYPYSEYLQDYMYQRNKLSEGGKFNDDFRVTRLGKVLRRYWLDELPMLINFFRGELKLVGVRPLSRQYLSLYPESVIQQRQAFKPGLLPPFYADLPLTLEQIIASELGYMEAYQRAPLRTDLRYLRRALYNMIIKKARSQ